ncbi:MAG TPA: leucyl aminopeptidase [Thermomicrobiales bacterium]|nr:leucyl aminopeptidase [Thermomicrobiales bacterium]
MDVTFQSGEPLTHAVDALVVPVTRTGDGPEVGGLAAEAAAKLGGELKTLIADARFTAKIGSTLRVPTLGNLPARHLILTGIGYPARLDADRVRRAWAAAALAARQSGAKTVASALPPAAGALDGPASLLAAAEGIRLATYRFTKYYGAARKDDPVPAAVDRWTFVSDGVEANVAAAALDQAAAIAAGVSLARDLVNEPASVINPVSMADIAREVAKDAGLEITVLGPEELGKLGAGAMLAVGKGSATPPQLIHLTYRPSGANTGKDDRVIGLIGKAITFDTGGYSIKTHEGMLEMKVDMSGGAAVLGAMAALAAVGCPYVVHGVICAAENMISDKAFRPGDILTASNGVTIEVHSTDAEGRLVLADGLVYTARQGATELIDLATLTGAAVVALGNGTTALFASDDDLAAALLDAASEAGESTWRMPLTKGMEEQIRGHIGDLKNTGGRPGGAITAALFLQHFREGLPWAHLDIAGTASASKARGYIPKGATGTGVRTLLTYLSGS